MMTVNLDAGFCPERWKKAVNVMLEKFQGYPGQIDLELSICWKQISIKY
jgi:hypothetical protein